jgi:hypothetical protein
MINNSVNDKSIYKEEQEVIKPIENEQNFQEMKFSKRKGNILDRFFKQKQAKELPTSIESQELWREINLFWPETIAITATVVATIAIGWFSRFLSINSLETIKPMLSEQAYTEIGIMIANMNTLVIAIGAVPLLVLIGFFLYRLFVFQPFGDKFLVARFKTTGGVRLSVDLLKNMKLKFRPNDPLTEEVTIKNPKKHWLDPNGKPFIVLIEGDDSNADITKLAGEVSQKSKDTNTINDMMFDFGVRWERKMREKANELLTPMNIILGLILIALVFLGFLIMNQPEAIVGALSG